MKFWFVVQTKPKKEGETNAYLASKGLEVFNPLIENDVIRSGKAYRVLKPLFPGYLFVRFDVLSDYTLVRWGRGVRKILALGGSPSRVPEDVIDLIKNRADSNDVVRVSYRFEPNDLVRIKAGPMKDLVGIIERRAPDRERVRVLLNLVEYRPVVELHCSILEKVA